MANCVADLAYMRGQSDYTKALDVTLLRLLYTSRMGESS